MKVEQIINDSNVYLDINMFSITGIEKIQHLVEYPFIKIEEIGSKIKRVVFKRSAADSIERVYSFLNNLWTTSYEYKSDTGYGKIYEYVYPEKIIGLDYMGTWEKTDYHLHDVFIINKDGSTSYGFGGEKGIKAVPLPDRFEEVKKVATTIVTDLIYEKKQQNS